MRISDWSSDVCSSDLVIDTVYRSTRRFCDDVLTAMGVEVSYFDPGVGSDIVAQIRPNTRAIFLETPGSLTFEMPDIAAITAVARPREIIHMLHNPWAPPPYFPPFKLGFVFSTPAPTK